jgi:glycosyltransferase involved in cell wall biosynthesis
MTAIRLLAIVESRIISGPARNLIEFVPIARSSGIETIVATFLRRETENFFTESLKNLSIPAFAVSEESAYDLSTIQKLKALVSELKPDLLQTHAVKSHFLTRLSGLPRSIPWIAFHHGYTSTSWRTGSYNQLDRWSLKAASQVVTVSHACLEQLRSKGVDTEKIKVLHNAVPVGYGSKADRELHGDSLRASLGIPPGAKVILSVGRLSKEKNQVALIEAIGALKGPLSPYLVIVGEGPEQDAIAQRAQALGLSRRLIMAGLQTDVRPFYTFADAVVISSTSEGSPNVLLEALAAGVPLVATAVGGIPEMVRDGEHALLVQDGNNKEMANAIARILSDSALAQRLIENGKFLVRTKFSPIERARTLSEMYQGILESKRSGTCHSGAT